MTQSRTQSPETPRRALAAEMDGHLGALRAQARRLCRSSVEAEDLVQDTVERALRFADTFEQGTNLRAWLKQILRSVFVTRCRRRQREVKAMERLTHDPCAWTHPEAGPEMTTLSPRVGRALSSLPDKFGSVVAMVDLGGLSYREAAEAMDVPVGTVMSRLFRARRMLASELAPAPALAA